MALPPQAPRALDFALGILADNVSAFPGTTIFAGDPLFDGPNATREARITAAIAYAVANGKTIVQVPAGMLPYNASLVTFNNAVHMLREGGRADVWEPQAYGAAGNAVFTARASGAGTFATITGQDDTVALQAAINASAANLGICLLTAQYKITATITLPNNAQVVGASWLAQICPNWFDASGGNSGGATYFANVDQVNGNTNITLTGFYMNGAGPGTPSASGLPNGLAGGVNFRGGSGGACTDITIQGCKWTNMPGICIAYQGCQRIRILYNTINNTGKDGITGCWHTARLQDVLVQGNEILNPGDDGIAVLASQLDGTNNSDQRPLRIVIQGNVVRDTQGSNFVGRGIIVTGVQDCSIVGNVVSNTFSCGIAVWNDTVGSNFSSQKVTISGNTIQDAGRVGNGTQPQHGISVRGANQVTVSGNTIDNAAQRGIEVADAALAIGTFADILVSGNTVTFCGTTPATDGAGIIIISSRLNNGCRRVNVVGNISSNNITGGIGVQDVDMVLISANQCNNNGTGGGHTEPECGIWVGANLTASLTMEVSNNFCTDTQGVKTQATGVTVRNLGVALGEVTIQDNRLKGNFNGAIQFGGEILVNLSPTTLIYRRDDPSSVPLTDAASVAVNLLFGSYLTLAATASRTIANPTNVPNGGTVTFEILNSSGGAIVTTWSANYILAGAWVDPANTKRRLITFAPNGTTLREVSRTAADM